MTPTRHEQRYFAAAVVCSTVFVIITFLISYSLWGYGGLPFGWDTPHYVEQANTLASQGLFALIAAQGPYDFVYQLLSGLIVWLGISALTIDVYLPIVLAALLPYLIGRVGLSNSDARLATFAVIATPGWYAIYTLAAGLYANLLGLALMLAATPFLLQSKFIRQPRTLAGIVLVAIASFTHIETTLLLSGVLIVSSLVFKVFPKKISGFLALTVLPATIIYIVHFLTLVSLTGYSLPTYSPEPVGFWIEIFGALFPLAIFGFFSPWFGKRSSIEIFVLIWGIASLLIGLSAYLDAQAYTFAQRAAELIPAPFLAALGLKRLGQFATNHVVWKVSTVSLRKIVLIGSILLIIVSWPTSYYASAYVNQRIFLPQSAYERLVWINNNMKFTNAPIFVYNDFDLEAGGYGDLYDNWVGAIIGNHLSYLGRIDYLIQVQQTPFSNVISRLHSAVFAQQLERAGVTDRTSLYQHPIIIVADFYNPYPIPSYYTAYFDQPHIGIFVANTSRLANLSNLTLPLSSAASSLTGPWFTSSNPWAESKFTLDADVAKPVATLEASFPFVTYSNGTYTIGLRYWDGTGIDMAVSLDGRTLGTVQYNDTQTPMVRNFTSLQMISGQHVARIQIDLSQSLPQYASLDYIVIEST